MQVQEGMTSYQMAIAVQGGEQKQLPCDDHANKSHSPQVTLLDLTSKIQADPCFDKETSSAIST